MPERDFAGQRPSGDDGSADPRCAAALAAYAQGEGGEHAALTALARSRLLIPVLARRDEGVSEMALPSLIGNDGRPALPAFTCLDALRRWRPAARPVPVAAALVWQAAVEQGGAVIIDVAGPVPLAVEGARLAALAEGRPPPPPHADPDVLALVSRALAAEQEITGYGVGPARHGADLAVRLSLATGVAAGAAQELATRLAAALAAGAPGSVRRGVEISFAGPFMGGSAACSAG